MDTLCFGWCVVSIADMLACGGFGTCKCPPGVERVDASSVDSAERFMACKAAERDGDGGNLKGDRQCGALRRALRMRRSEACDVGGCFCADEECCSAENDYKANTIYKAKSETVLIGRQQTHECGIVHLRNVKNWLGMRERGRDDIGSNAMRNIICGQPLRTSRCVLNRDLRSKTR